MCIHICPRNSTLVGSKGSDHLRRAPLALAAYMYVSHSRRQVMSHVSRQVTATCGRKEGVHRLRKARERCVAHQRARRERYTRRPLLTGPPPRAFAGSSPRMSHALTLLSPEVYAKPRNAVTLSAAFSCASSDATGANRLMSL